MLFRSTNLKSIDVSKFDTRNVIYMGATFDHCSSLSSLDLSNFDTTNVTMFTYMFYNCSELQKLDCSNFVIAQNDSDIGAMFGKCPKLQQLNINKIDLTNHVGNITGLFKDVKDNIQIITNQKMKIWLQNKFARFTNVQVISI